MSRIFVIILMLFSLSISPASFAVQDSTTFAGDNRIRTYIYDPNEVFVFTAHYRYQSSIELSPDESIQSITMGDSIAWQVVSAGSRLFLKPVENDATTNMTVITDRRIYHFELHAEVAEDIRDDEMVFSARFFYPETGSIDSAFRQFENEESLEDQVAKNRQDYNFNYTITGSRLIAPLKIFDDGEFTYMQFRDKNADVPAIFSVNIEGNESIVNFRVDGDYIIVEKVGHQYTLRHGEDITCVFNEADPLIRERSAGRGKKDFSRRKN